MHSETGPAANELIHLAARLRAEDPTLGCLPALRKAGERLGQAVDPSFVAIDCERLETETRQYQLTFRPQQAEALVRLRREALAAMEYLAAFEPRVVGSVLSGTADTGTTVTLHAFADAPEEVMMRLLENEIPFDESDRVYRYRSGRKQRAPVFSFEANGVPFDVVVFPLAALREAPLGTGLGGAMQRASRAQLRALVETG